MAEKCRGCTLRRLKQCYRVFLPTCNKFDEFFVLSAKKIVVAEIVSILCKNFVKSIIKMRVLHFAEQNYYQFSWNYSVAYCNVLLKTRNSHSISLLRDRDASFWFHVIFGKKSWEFNLQCGNYGKLSPFFGKNFVKVMVLLTKNY